MNMPFRILLSFFLQFLLFIVAHCHDDETCHPVYGINRGVAALVGEFPFSVALLYEDYVTRCSGAILTKKHILTAAHCPVNNKGVEIHELMVGDVVKPPCDESNLKTLELRSFSKYYRHPKYFVHLPPKMWFVKNAQYDIAVIVVDKPFKYSFAVRPIQLCEKRIKIGSACALPGWGRLHWNIPNSTNNLMFRYDTIRDKSKCKSAQYNIICGGPRFGCPGDCGSPLVADDDKVYGVFNTAIKVSGTFYMIYADVFWHRKWILSIIKEDDVGIDNSNDSCLDRKSFSQAMKKAKAWDIITIITFTESLTMFVNILLFSWF